MTSDVRIHQPNDPGIQLAPAAVKHIQQYLAKHPDTVGLRLYLTKTGCSGLSYQMELVDTVNAEDWCSVTNEGIHIYVAADAVEFLRGTTIDYVTEGLNQHFEFDNPNEAHRCGCGESFTVED